MLSKQQQAASLAHLRRIPVTTTHRPWRSKSATVLHHVIRTQLAIRRPHPLLAKLVTVTIIEFGKRVSVGVPFALRTFRQTIVVLVHELRSPIRPPSVVRSLFLSVPISAHELYLSVVVTLDANIERTRRRRSAKAQRQEERRAYHRTTVPG